MDPNSVIRLRRVVLGLARRMNAASVGEGLTPSQASVLGIVVNRGPLGLAELTEIEGLNPTMLSRVVGKLDSFGMIRRLRDPDDFRAARVEVTPDGEKAWQRISLQRTAIISECVAGLPAEQEVDLVAALPGLENLSESLKTAAQHSRGQQSRYEPELGTSSADRDHRRPLFLPNGPWFSPASTGPASAGLGWRRLGPAVRSGQGSGSLRVDDEDVAVSVPP